MKRLFPLLALFSCQTPEMGDSFNQISVDVATSPEDASAAFVKLIDGAKKSLHVAIPVGEDVAIATALVAAHERGVAVEVITDIDQASDPGIVLLSDNFVPLTLADAGLTYFEFNINADVSFSSEACEMSHAYVVADRKKAISGTSAGHAGAGDTVLFHAQGEQIIEDMLSEHLQVFGGIDAVSTTAYDSLAKSITDVRYRYPTQTDLDVEVWFGPQERLTKRVIDAVYGARASVHILTNELANDGLIRALEVKGQDGFNVRVIVGPNFGLTSARVKRLYEDAVGFEKLRSTRGDVIPTVVIVDYNKARDGKKYKTQVMVISHDLFSASRLVGGQPITNDQLIDGTMWTLVDYDDPSAEINTLFDLWTSHADSAEAF